MKIFLAWSGPASRQLALLLRRWLPDVIHQIVPFMSDEDIRSGQRWLTVIGNQLKDTNFAVLCVTPKNRDSTWMHFEAGAVSKDMEESRVCTLLYRLTQADLEMPLRQFQGRVADRDGVHRLLLDIDEKLGEKRLGKERIHRIFEKFWPDFEAELASVEAALQEELQGREVRRRSAEEMFADVLETQRGMLKRLESLGAQFAEVQGRLVLAGPGGSINIPLSPLTAGLTVHGGAPGVGAYPSVGGSPLSNLEQADTPLPLRDAAAVLARRTSSKPVSVADAPERAAEPESKDGSAS